MAPTRSSSSKGIGFLVAAVVTLLIAALFLWINQQNKENAKFGDGDSLINGQQFVPVTAPALKAGGPAPSNAYGWKWNKTVLVYDGTNNPIWRVRDAVATWNRDGLSIQMTSDQNQADIVVTQGDAMAMCGTQEPVIGCGDTTVTNGQPVSGRIVMQESYSDWVYPTTNYGGTIHELGHTIGFGHAPAPLTNQDSVMGIPINATCGGGCARTTLSSYDTKGLRALY